MTLTMPPPDQSVLRRRDAIVSALREIVPGEGVISDERRLKVYESDGLTAYRQPPMVAVLPETVEQVSAILRWCHAEGVKVVPRGSGTSLSGGALPLEDAVLLGMSKFNRILAVDYADRVAVVQPGVTNLAVTRAVEAAGFYYAPDPSSQIACSIGGNVAENSGGVHCLKYGLTTNNVLGLQVVLMNGEVVRLGGRHLDAAGLDLVGLMVGSEGLLGVANVFHAGDGNLHPLIMYDANLPGQLERAEAFGADILRLCVEVGGVLTGEHGVGVETRDLMPDKFTETDLAHQQRVKWAFDPKLLLNPGKVFPSLHRCAEMGRVHVHGGRTAFPDLPRF